MAEEFGEKTHEATPYRKQKAREEGNVAKSQDLVAATILLVAIGILIYFGRPIAEFLATLVRQALTDPAIRLESANEPAQWGLRWLLNLGMILAPVLLAITSAAILGNLLQSGLLYLPQKLAPDFSRLDIVKGLQRLFAPQNYVRLGFSLSKMALIGGVAIYVIWPKREEVLTLWRLETLEIGMLLSTTTLDAGMKIASAVFVLALTEYGYEFWKYNQDLKMTTQEVREEMKTLQGDPQIVQRRRQIHKEMVKGRLSVAVPKANVIITNPTELAIAIQYDYDTMEAPIVLAKGAGALAQQIRRLALENSIPVVERKELARALYKLVDVGRPVPFEQYSAVAEVLRYVYQLTGKTLPAAPPKGANAPATEKQRGRANPAKS
jgi:flagellar biosynthesis protein FlhB